MSTDKTDKPRLSGVGGALVVFCGMLCFNAARDLVPFEDQVMRYLAIAVFGFGGAAIGAWAARRLNLTRPANETKSGESATGER